MTKSAVLMSGHPRNFEKSFTQFKKILPDSDFYALLLNVTNSVEKTKNPTNANDITNTQNYLEQLSKEDNFFYSFVGDEEIDMDQYRTCVSLFNHFDIPGKTFQQITEKWLRQVNDYKRSFEWMSSHNKQYDLVYRIRPDLIVKKNDYILDRDIDKFNCFHQTTNIDQVNDKFFYSNFNNMQKFMVGMIDSLKNDKIGSITNSRFNVEQYLYRYLKHLNFNLNFISTNNFYMKKIMTDGEELCAGFPS
tara:strand:- start:1504 stop:2247 length:744 start_codon:yes stop_codon:yes gene_type:complete